MTNQPIMDEGVRRDLELAYLVCGLRAGVERGGGRDMELDVAREYLRIRRLMSQKSLPARVAESVSIRCTIQAIEYEESSKRYLVKFIADRANEPETIRSDRTDGLKGESVAALWKDLRPGMRAIVFKRNENATAERSNGFRVAPYVIPLGD